MVIHPFIIRITDSQAALTKAPSSKTAQNKTKTSSDIFPSMSQNAMSTWPTITLASGKRGLSSEVDWRNDTFMPFFVEFKSKTLKAQASYNCIFRYFNNQINIYITLHYNKSLYLIRYGITNYIPFFHNTNLVMNIKSIKRVL